MNKLGKYWMAAMAMWSGGQAMATEPYTVGKLLGIPEFNTLGAVSDSGRAGDGGGGCRRIQNLYCGS